jgi:hypothetical protein
LERPSEVSRVFSAQQHLWEQRRLFVSAVSDFNASASPTSFPDFLSFQLTQYESSIHRAAQQGVHHVPRVAPDQETAAHSASWGYLHSVFFASTVLTTIGKKKNSRAWFGKKINLQKNICHTQREKSTTAYFNFNVCLKNCKVIIQYQFSQYAF